MSRKLLAQQALISEDIMAAFRDESDEALPRTIVTALARLRHGAQTAVQKARPDANHWFASSFYLNPALLSAATLRVARVIDGASGLSVCIGMPRRANDFPAVTPLGLHLFYRASLLHARMNSISPGVMDEFFTEQSVTEAIEAHAGRATLSDALLLSLVPSARKMLVSSSRQDGGGLAEIDSELAVLSDLMADLRSGILPESLSYSCEKTPRDLLGCESFHGLLKAAARAMAADRSKSECWPTLISAYLPGGPAHHSGQGTRDVPLTICALASTWLKVGWRNLTPLRKDELLKDFSRLIAGCAHDQAGFMEVALKRSLAESP